MELTELERLRVEKLERLRGRGIEPYPRRVTRTHTIAEALATRAASRARTPSPRRWPLSKRPRQPARKAPRLRSPDVCAACA
jgi:lysyl-tRNA synthetase class II